MSLRRSKRIKKQIIENVIEDSESIHSNDSYSDSDNDNDDDDDSDMSFIIDDDCIEYENENENDNEICDENILSSLQKLLTQKIKKIVEEDENMLGDESDIDDSDIDEEYEEIVNEIREYGDKQIPEFKEFFKKNIPMEIKVELLRKIEHLQELDISNSEYHKLEQWINNLIRIPFGKFPELEYNDKPVFVKDFKENLDKCIYGQTKAKDKLTEIIVQWMMNPDSNGQVIGLCGQPGTGKTKIIKHGLSKGLNKPFQYMSLGGLTDSSFLDGHCYTYEGSTHGRLVDMLMKSNCMNPIIFMDELDKVSESKVGKDIIGKLIHLTDHTQNNTIHDKYFSGIDIDFSKVFFIFSFNDINAIDKILLDRIKVIHMDNFKSDDKVNIAKDYLLPEIMKENNLNVNFSRDLLEHLAIKFNESGVRKLKQELENIIMKLNVIKLIPEKNKLITVTENMLITRDIYTKLKMDNFDDNISLRMMYL